MLRDLVTEDTTRIIVDSRETFARLQDFATDYVPKVLPKLEHYAGERPLFDLFAVEEEIEKALARRVDLKSGGYLIIDQTEALTTIDVNTGGFVGGRNFDDTIFKTNLEAAQAIARQLRLRNLGGIIVVDFIDMENEEHRDAVLAEFQKALARDRTRMTVNGFSQLGLVEMTRKRTRESLAHVLCEPCPTCTGRGSRQDRAHDLLRDPARDPARGAAVQRPRVPHPRLAERDRPLPRRGVAVARDARRLHRQADLDAGRDELHAGAVRRHPDVTGRRMQMLEGRVAIVTGAGGGIGREMALALAGAGAKVVVNDIGASLAGEGADQGPAERVAGEIRARGGAAAPNTDSVSTWASANRIVQTALDAFGRIDCVVNNAGILRDRLFHKMTVEDWEAVIQVHLMGSFYVSRAAATHFREQERGAYVHMTSTSGLIGNVGQANYAAAKLGIAALSKSIALDMQRFKVRSNCISPFAWSRMIASIPAETPEAKARVAKLQRMEAGKIAPMAVFLASDAAQGRDRPDLRRARKRDLPDEPAASGALGPPGGGLDPGDHRRAGAARARPELRAARGFGGRLQLGPDLGATDGTQTETDPQRPRLEHVRPHRRSRQGSPG